MRVGAQEVYVSAEPRQRVDEEVVVVAVEEPVDH